MNKTRTMTSRRWTWMAVGAAAILMGGCAVELAQPGMARQDVIARYGTPTRAVPLPNGGSRLQYSRQPAGQSVVMVDLDTLGKVVQSREVMTIQEFSKIMPGQWTRADVEREFGPPASIGHTGNWPDDILTYRWRDQIVDKFFWVFVDAKGAVARVQQGVEFLNVPPEN
jgi:hypothetical protein